MPPYVTEYWGKEAEDLFLKKMSPTFVNGAVIVGAGPSGIATAACLQQLGIPSLIIEKSECIGSLWKNQTYDRLHLHLPKQFCELPYFPFPAHYPTYPTRHQFVEYLENYTQRFNLKPRFNESVDMAAFDQKSGLWRVHTSSTGKASVPCVAEYRARWLVVASGENAEAVSPSFKGLKDYEGKVFHSSHYKNGACYAGRKVLVVGCGNSGMEIALDLVNFNAKPSLVVRNPVHVLPREIFGNSTFALAMKLMTTIPQWLTDWLLVWYTRLKLGNTAKYGFFRPKDGPMALKQKFGKTPVLDVGTFSKIKSGDIKVVPAIEYFTATGVRFEDGQTEDFEAIVLATGFRSNVPKWFKDDDKFFSEEGFPRTQFSNGGWKGTKGLYVAGLGRKGLLGASFDAKRIAEDISMAFHTEIQPLRVLPCQHR